MAQMTGTQMVALARAWVSDQDSTNPAVSDTDALLYLNDHLVWWGDVMGLRDSILSPTTTGFSFAGANTSSAVRKVSTVTTIEAILSVHPNNYASTTYPLAPPLQPKTLEEILCLYGDKGDGQSSAQAGGSTPNDWQCWAAERDTNNSDAWAIWVYPAISTTGYLTVRATLRLAIAALANTPDMDYRAAYIVSRFLAYDMARVQRSLNQQWVERLMWSVPQDILDKRYGEGRFKGGHQATIRQGTQD